MLVLSNSTEHCLSWREPVSQWYYQRWYVMGTQRQWPSNTDSHTMSCGETISSDLIKPWLVFCEAHGQPPCSLWFIVRGAAGDGGQTRGWPAQHQAGDLWDQPRDPEAEIWDWPRQEAGTVGTMEEKSILSFLDHQVSSNIMWVVIGHWGKSRERRTCHGWVFLG